MTLPAWLIENFKNAFVGNKLCVTPDLPSGAATATNQTAGNTSLAVIAKRYANNTNLTINLAAAGEATVISAPAAGNRIVIQSIFMTCLVNNIVLMKAGSTEIGRAYVYGFSKDYISGLVLPAATAFVLTPNTDDPIMGQVCYYVEAVP